MRRKSLQHLLSLLLALTFVLPMAMLAEAQERVSYVPSVDYKSFLIKQALKSSKKRERVITILRDLLKLYPEGEEKAQLQVRLAQLYLDKARHLYFLELYKNDPEAEKLIAGELSFQREQANKLKLENSFAFNRRAINIYRNILKRYPKLSNSDEVLFFLAYNLGEVGKTEDALNLYRRLIAKYPKSRYVPEAYLVQGEYKFYSNDMNAALVFYRRVLRYKDSAVRDLAIYKIAWCHFNRTNVRTALKTLEQLIANAASRNTALDLKEEAIRDLVVMFSYGGYYKEAPFYFKQIGGDTYYRDMLKQLASLYYRQGKNSYARAMYKRIIREDKGDKENPEFQKRLVEIAKRLGRKQDVITEANALVRFYSDESRWSAKNRNDWNALQQARELSEKTLRSVALSLHNEAQKTRDERTYSLAMASYREYLDNFPDTKIANTIRFYYAESLFKLKKREPAAVAYAEVLDRNPKGKFALQAGYGAIVSYDELVKELPPIQSKDGKTPLFIPLWQRQLVKVSDSFTTSFPKDKRTPQIMFKAAKVFYDHNNFKEAIRRFDRVVMRYPKSAAATFAANLVLDSWNIQERWAQVVKWGKRYYNNKQLPAGRFKQDLFTIIEKSSFKVARSQEESGRYLVAAKSYEQFANDFKTSDFVDDSLNNAAVSYRKGRNIEKSIAVFRRLVKQQPKSPFVERSILAIGRGYEDLARFKLAAYYYELYQKRYPQAKRAADLIYNAAVFRENLGQIDKAIANYTIYINKYPDQKDAATTDFAIAMIYEKEKRWPEASKTYQRLAAKYRNNANFYLTALVKWGQALSKSGKKTKALSAYKTAINGYAKTNKRKLGQDTVDLVAEAHYLYTEPKLKRFKQVRLDVGLARFETNIREKTRRLDGLIKAYQKIIDYGSSVWLAASIYRLANAYDDFAVNLSRVKPSNAMRAEVREQFVSQIQTFTDNMRNKSVEAYRACLDRSQELSVFHPVVAKAEKRLADLTAEAQTEVQEVLHQPVFVQDAIGEGKLL